MQINLEKPEQHAVQAYSNTQIQINSVLYEGSLIVSPSKIISDVAIKDIELIDEDYINLLLSLKPELIIIGHKNTGKFPPMKLMADLSQKGIGMECMELGAACRTYNVLIGEHRLVVAGFVF